MKILSEFRSSSQVTYMVVFTEEEKKMTDQEMINYIDSRGSNKDRKANYGGAVHRDNYGPYKVIVYVD